MSSGHRHDRAPERDFPGLRRPWQPLCARLRGFRLEPDTEHVFAFRGPQNSS